MCLAYCKVFWMGMGVRGKGKAFFSKKVSPGKSLPLSLLLNSQLALLAGMPDQREGNYVQRHFAQPKSPNMAATPGCPPPCPRARARARVLNKQLIWIAKDSFFKN